MKTRKVIITDRALRIVRQIEKNHGPVIFHQSGGCCDGSSPMCLPKGDFMIDDNDEFLGDLEGVPFYMSKFQYNYWKHTQLTIDVVEGRGSSFSLEIPMGLRFVVKSRLFTDEEIKSLESEKANKENNY
ncbi:DUF779 domain-containing protein [Membranihabitans maritimus]|uniref:DUF779 domain-containing protein n=1 Tax=Membranihabitans maritimus TaxID=2904244 RepID=UPI001F317F2B|nr:DUF779 domain-containing protein [Membranihabitans maritimus]